jgi:hypothetical protein
VRLRRGVEVLSALLWLASGGFWLASAALSHPNLSKGAQLESVYWNVWAAATAALGALTQAFLAMENRQE